MRMTFIQQRAASRFAGMALLGLCLSVFLPSPAAAEDPYLTISERDCRLLTRHLPSADVAYQPGVDVRGKPVVSADLGAGDPSAGSGLVLPQAVVIPIEVDLFDRFGIPAGGVNFEADAFIGEVTVDLATGEAYFNGQPLQSEAGAELAARCQRIIRGTKTAE